MRLLLPAVLSLLFLCSCAYTEINNNYTANGDSNTFPTEQRQSTSKPVDVNTDLKGSGYGDVGK